MKYADSNQNDLTKWTRRIRTHIFNFIQSVRRIFNISKSTATVYDKSVSIAARKTSRSSLVDTNLMGVQQPVDG